MHIFCVSNCKASNVKMYTCIIFVPKGLKSSRENGWDIRPCYYGWI